MQFGIVLPSWLYNEERKILAAQCVADLEKTRQPSKQPFLLVVAASLVELEFYKGNPLLNAAFFIEAPRGVTGTEMPLAWGTQYLLDTTPVTHIVWMGDDARFHPDWLLELEALILRRPGARAWSVYHSAHQKYHTDLQVWRKLYDDRTYRDDVLVRSICGHGLTLTREEWKAWGIDWRHGNDWANAGPLGGNTLDLHHAYYRPGDRWVTEKSYIDHVGKHGLHVTPDVPEYGLGFVGVGV